MRMRQKVSISQLPIRLGIFLLLYLVPQSLSAQENNDSTHILRNGASITPDDVLKQANINLFPEKSTTYSLYSPGQLEHIPRFSLKRDISLPYQTNPSLLFRGDYSTGGYCINSIVEHCSVPEVRQVWQASGVSTVLH